MKKFLFFCATLIVAIDVSATITTMTCAEATQYIMDSLQSGQTGTDSVAITGYVTSTNSIISRGQQTFWLDDTKGSTQTFQAYWCNIPSGEEALNVGDKVTIRGFLSRYKDIAEMKEGDTEILERTAIDIIDTIEATICEVIEEGRALNDEEVTNDFYKVSGVVASVTQRFNPQYKNETFILRCDGCEVPVYHIFMKDNVEAVVGDGVVVIGRIRRYDSRIELMGGTATVLPSFSMTFAGDPITGGDVQQISIVNVTTNERLIEAFPNYGYHFTQWSDGNTDNPRIVTLTQDTTFIAEFARNTYTVTVVAANIEEGKTEELSALYLDEVEISATPNYGYHFVQWSDGNTDNPRVVTLTQDMTFIAEFARNTYFVRTESANTLMGNTAGDGHALYLDEVEISATSNYGYHFLHWSDGNTNNPRTIVLTQDTTLIAEFALDRKGTCGDNNALTWSYNPNDQTLAITGNGTLNNNYTFGLEATAEMQQLVIAEGVTAIGNNAFSNISTLAMIQLPASLKTIGAKAFENCIDLMYIYNYRERPCIVDATAFDGVNKFDCTLYVLEGSVDMYKSAGSNWKDFYFILPIGSTTVTEPVSDVIVEPADNTATVIWPTNDNAVSYTIEITKDGEVFCTLIFNANGQLTGIAFAPSRDGQAHAPAAVMTANGLQFTVTGLNSNTQYGYSVTAKDSSDATIASYSGNFTTTGEGVATGVEEISSSLQGGDRGRLILRNGQIFILRGDKTYTLTGAEVK